MDYPKSVPGVGLVNGRFVNEDAIAGRPGSLIPAEWGNAITDEVLAVVQAGALEPDEENNAQLLQAILALIKDAVADRVPIRSWSQLPTSDIGPIIVAEFGEVWTWVPAPFSGYRSPNCGAVDYFDSLSAPVGYLKANFAAVSRTTYRGLFSIVGTRHGAGDGVTTFNLPEGRAEFIRGWDDGRGVDSSRVLGSMQLATSMYFSPNSPSTGGAASTQAQNVDSSVNGGSPSVTYSSGGGTPASVFTVRPRNIALLACIKI